MKELDKELRTILEMFFDKKIKEAKLSNDLQDKIWEMVDNCVEDIQDIAAETNRDIDYAIEEEDAEYNDSFMNEMSADMNFRERELI